MRAGVPKGNSQQGSSRVTFAGPLGRTRRPQTGEARVIVREDA